MEWPAHLPLVRGGGVSERAGSESEKRERKEFFFSVLSKIYEN